MNLVIDIGNSRTKTAIFSDGELVGSTIVDTISQELPEDLKRQFPAIDWVILSSVTGSNPLINSQLQTTFPHLLEFSSITPLPIRNDYQTPETLGLDRLAAAVGANYLFPKKDLLVIDAGTAITFDLVKSNGTFAGGNISPGLSSRFKALHEFTRQLPLLDASEEPPEIGQTTHDAIRAGVIGGLTFEIDGTIDYLRQRHPGLEVVLTGGDARYFERRLKNPIFVKSEITLIGLNRILEYNVEKL